MKYLISTLIVSITPALFAADPTAFFGCNAECVALDTKRERLQELGSVIGASATSAFDAFRDLQEACEQRIKDRTCDYGASESMVLAKSVNYEHSSSHSQSSSKEQAGHWYYGPWTITGGYYYHYPYSTQQTHSSSNSSEKFGAQITAAIAAEVCQSYALAPGQTFTKPVQKRNRIYCGKNHPLP